MASNVIIKAVSEAPIDGSPYSRQDGTWVAASTGGIPEAPTTLSYVRANTGWSLPNLNMGARTDTTFNLGISNTNLVTALPMASISLAGIMPAADKSKLDGLVGIPSGGSTSQVLSKIDGVDYNVAWVTPSGGGGTDPDAIHNNVAAEINSITTKSTLKSTDYILIEDSEDSFNKKSADLSGLMAMEANTIIDIPTGSTKASIEILLASVPNDLGSFTLTLRIDAGAVLTADALDYFDTARFFNGYVEIKPASGTVPITFDSYMRTPACPLLIEDIEFILGNSTISMIIDMPVASVVSFRDCTFSLSSSPVSITNYGIIQPSTSDFSFTNCAFTGNATGITNTYVMSVTNARRACTYSFIDCYGPSIDMDYIVSGYSGDVGGLARLYGDTSWATTTITGGSRVRTDVKA
jgi:hypothetical protein